MKSASEFADRCLSYSMRRFKLQTASWKSQCASGPRAQSQQALQFRPGHYWFCIKEREIRNRPPVGIRAVSHLIIQSDELLQNDIQTWKTSALTGETWYSSTNPNSRRTVERKEKTCSFKHVRRRRAVALMLDRSLDLKDSLWKLLCWKFLNSGFENMFY